MFFNLFKRHTTIELWKIDYETSKHYSLVNSNLLGKCI